MSSNRHPKRAREEDSGDEEFTDPNDELGARGKTQRVEHNNTSVATAIAIPTTGATISTTIAATARPTSTPHRAHRRPYQRQRSLSPVRTTCECKTMIPPHGYRWVHGDFHDFLTPLSPGLEEGSKPRPVDKGIHDPRANEGSKKLPAVGADKGNKGSRKPQADKSDEGSEIPRAYKARDTSDGLSVLEEPILDVPLSVAPAANMVSAPQQLYQPRALQAYQPYEQRRARYQRYWLDHEGFGPQESNNHSLRPQHTLPSPPPILAATPNMASPSSPAVGFNPAGYRVPSLFTSPATARSMLPPSVQRAYDSYGADVSPPYPQPELSGMARRAQMLQRNVNELMVPNEHGRRYLAEARAEEAARALQLNLPEQEDTPTRPRYTERPADVQDDLEAWRERE